MLPLSDDIDVENRRNARLPLHFDELDPDADSTLSKPEKVLKNLGRAQGQGRECIFIVNEEKVDRLEHVLDDIDEEQYRILISTDIGVIEP